MVKKEMERYGKVNDITRDFFREKGFETVESNTRTVRLTLKEGYTVESLPHEIRLESCKVLVVVPGRAPLCLRCRRTGHIRRDCRVPRCTECHRYGHKAEDCVKTYASMARDRREDDQSDFLMDDAEAEEAVGGLPSALPSSDKGVPPEPAGTYTSVAVTGTGVTDCAPQVPGTDTKETLQLPTPKEGSAQLVACATGEGEGGQLTPDASASENKDVEMDSSQPTKRLWDQASSSQGDAREGDTSQLPWNVQGPKKSRGGKPRAPLDARQRKDSK
ncbi:hypothetical protein HPB47_002568 [Ixodes persulcatus]|uniref:Uncharacterized protein n=1 Tax=Ixodes persulcatus TaxID=34615 RepID=A0AC60PKX4_IXOPE|nr:hypothetical protein HPB47_002568 [Ixodes persulcatus]